MELNIEVNFRLKSWPNHPICNKGSKNRESFIRFVVFGLHFKVPIMVLRVLFLVRPQFRLDAFGLWGRRRLAVSKWGRNRQRFGNSQMVTWEIPRTAVTPRHACISFICEPYLCFGCYGFRFCIWSYMICELNSIKSRVSLYILWGYRQGYTQGYTLVRCLRWNNDCESI